MVKVFQLNAHKSRIQQVYVIAPKEAVDLYVSNHPLYESLRNTHIPCYEVEVLGSLGSGVMGQRILITGDFPYYEKRRTWEIATTRLGAPYGSDYGYEGEDYPLLGEGRHIINGILGADGGTTEIPIEELAKVSSYTETKESGFPEVGHAPYAQRAITRLNLVMNDGSQRVAYVHSVGYFEGYQYDLYGSRKTAYREVYATLRAKAKQDWIDTECWECGAVYPEPGHVEPGQMGCDHCNR